MVTSDKAFLCHAPKVQVQSKFGPEEVLVGAMVLAFSKGEPPEQALRWGVVAPRATVSAQGTALFVCETVTGRLRYRAVKEV